MPESNVKNKEIVLEQVRLINKRRLKILDVGIGWGNFGELIKTQSDKKIHLTGIEIFEKYRNRKWHYYDRIIIGDATKIISNLKGFDLILAIDIIEHLPKEKGLSMLKQLKNKTKRLIISIPVIDYPQNPKYGNIYERHLSQWKINEMLNLGSELLYFNNIIGCFLFKK